MTDSPPTEYVAEDVDMTLDEMAAAWLEADEMVARYARVKRALESQLFNALRERDAKEIATDSGVIELEAQYGPYEWDTDVLMTEGKPLMTPQEWDKAIEYEHIPARTETQVKTASMKSALTKKGTPGKDVLARAMSRKERDGRVKVRPTDG